VTLEEDHQKDGTETQQHRADSSPASEPASSPRPRVACDPIPERALGAAFESGTADDAWVAIQCARRAGLSGDAERALLVFRERYGTDPRRATAAFLLGKLTFARGAFAMAATWFDASRREAPAGQLARESAGRRIEALQRAGEMATAMRAAREYLTTYPEGPHARLARSLLAP
jgi:TolA-binding protein